MRGKPFSTLLFLTTLLCAPMSARAITYTITGGGVDLAQLCSDALCITETMTWDDLGGAIGGTITVDGGTVDLDLDVTVISFSGSDSGVSTYQLQTLNYLASGIAIVGTPDDFTAVGTASVAGTEDEDGGTSAFSDPSAAINFDCNEIATSVLKCGISLAGLTFNVSVGGSARFLPHTIDATAVPEPGLSVIALTAGLAGLACGRGKGSN